MTRCRLPAAALTLTLTLALALPASLCSAQTPDARRLSDSTHITGEVVEGARNLKHRLRITYRQAPTQELLIEASSETVFANMLAAYTAYLSKDSASKDYARVVSPSGWVLVIHWPEVASLHRWTERP